MSAELQSVAKMTSLKTDIEAVTGYTYGDLTEAVQALKDGYGSSEVDPVDFVGVKYSEFDEDGYPTIADARSLGKTSANPAHLMTGLLYSSANNNSLYNRIKEVYLPDNITQFIYSFQHCTALEKLHGNFDKVTVLGNACFSSCVSLKELPYFPNVVRVTSGALVNCTGLTSIKFYKTLTNFATNALQGCTNLTDIYVPWAEGEVANAPWSAPNENLVIHYNTTYDENHNPILEEPEQ